MHGEGEREDAAARPRTTRGAQLLIGSATVLLLGIVLGVGHLDLLRAVAISAETAAFLAYLFLRSRVRGLTERPVASLLGLYPGHLVLLLAALLVRPASPALVVLWMVLPVTTVLYDAVSSCAGIPTRLQLSISVGLYCILWAVLFALVERLIVVGRDLSGTAEAVTGGLFVGFGLLFLALGVYRHRAARSFKE